MNEEMDSFVRSTRVTWAKHTQACDYCKKPILPGKPYYVIMVSRMNVFRFTRAHTPRGECGL